jgi:hypothetical protein
MAKVQTKKTEDGVKHLQWVTKPDEAVTHDEAFWVKKQRWGTFVSVLADDTQLITALTEELCISSTRWYLKQRQEGFGETKTYESEVGGKL